MRTIKPTNEERQEARRLLGDVIADTLDKVGIAALVKKHFKDCGCAGRRRKLNDLHLQLTRRYIKT